MHHHFQLLPASLFFTRHSLQATRHGGATTSVLSYQSSAIGELLGNFEAQKTPE